MDLSEPLNRAHRNQRTAERAFQRGDLNGAIENYSKAADDLNRAESIAARGRRRDQSIDTSPSPSVLVLVPESDSYVLESLIAQRRFCLRQIELLTNRIEQIRRHWTKLMDEQKKGGDRLLSNLDYDRAANEAIVARLDRLSATDEKSDFDTNDLRARLWEKISEQDSLLGRLENAGGGLDIGGGPSKTTPAAVDDPNIEAVAKCPKSDKTIIEELRQCNEALRNYIVILLSELDAKTNEIDRLKKRLVDDSSSSSSPGHRQRSSTTPTRGFGKGRKRATSEAAAAVGGQLPDLPPLDFPPPALRPLNDSL